MKRRVGYMLVFAGAILALASYAFRFPAKVSVGGYTGDVFAISAGLGLGITMFGILLIRREAK